ncbi:TPA: acyltransferase [Enterobacter roggenkampii]
MNRIYWLDATRAIAILLVVFTHAHEQAGISNELLRSLFYSFDRLGVPLFFMISGGLILPKLGKGSTISFYKKRIPQFLILLVVYSIITNSVKMIGDGANLIDAIFTATKMNNGIYPADYGGAAQLWFLYSIIGMYLIAPFLAKIVNNSTTKEISVFLAICVLLNQFKMSLPLIGVDWGFLYKLGSDMTGPYVSFFIAGYLVINRTDDFNNLFKSTTFHYFLFIAPIVILTVIDFFSNKMNEYLHWYSSSIFIFTSGIGLFLVIKGLFEHKSGGVLTGLSLYSFGIYLSHYAFIYICQWIFKSQISEMDELNRTTLYFYFSLIFGFAFSFIMSKFKATRYFVQ